MEFLESLKNGIAECSQIIDDDHSTEAIDMLKMLLKVSSDKDLSKNLDCHLTSLIEICSELQTSLNIRRLQFYQGYFMNMTEKWMEQLFTWIRLLSSKEIADQYSVECKAVDYTLGVMNEKLPGSEVHICMKAHSPSWAMRDISHQNPRSIVLTSSTLPDLCMLAHRFGLENPSRASIGPVVDLESQVIFL